MSRARLLVALLATTCVGLLSYSFATRTQRVSQDSGTKTPVVSRVKSDEASPSESSDPTSVQQGKVGSPAIPTEIVAKWVADTNNSDPKTRAAAIIALASAPRSHAVPALLSVLRGGEPETDRQLAVGSLREVAMDQGDADGVIRNALRQAIYHGDDADVGLAAQAAVGDIDASASGSP